MFGNKKQKLMKEYFKKQSHFERKSGLSIGLVLVIIGGVWYAVEMGYVDLTSNALWAASIIAVGALLMLRGK